eukprot:scaffold7247_cov143-Skeletonema_menzelii.AAC.1
MISNESFASSFTLSKLTELGSSYIDSLVHHGRTSSICLEQVACRLLLLADLGSSGITFQGEARSTAAGMPSNTPLPIFHPAILHTQLYITYDSSYFRVTREQFKFNVYML